MLNLQAVPYLALECTSLRVLSTNELWYKWCWILHLRYLNWCRTMSTGESSGSVTSEPCPLANLRALLPQNHGYYITGPESWSVSTGTLPFKWWPVFAPNDRLYHWRGPGLNITTKGVAECVSVTSCGSRSSVYTRDVWLMVLTYLMGPVVAYG
jgi:hypothetical protein